MRVAVVDTGFGDHPYYATAAIRTPPGESRSDKSGHGTAITANLHTVAPDAEISVHRQSDPPQDALEEAVDQGARVVSCSWGWDREQSFPMLEATIRQLVEEGVVVLFAAGNGHHAWPGTMPDVISVGGVYLDPHRALHASDYASGFLSSLYIDPPRRVPDVCGLCGLAPRGIYIPMPCPPGCEMDRGFGGNGFPDQDETLKNDGWVVASGTSSATPQVAGIVALLLADAARKGSTLSPAAVKRILEETAEPVTSGRNAFGFLATGHPNAACGYGLVHAERALARV